MSRNQEARIIRELMSAEAIEAALLEMKKIILQSGVNFEDLIILGVASRGVPLAESLAKLIQEDKGIDIKVGNIDATFYRDDFHFRNRFKNPALQVSSLTTSLDGKIVILVDDVLFTGRSVRAAINAIMDLGRPSCIRLFVLVDRDKRELPIRADFTAIQIKTEKNEEIRVNLKPIDQKNGVDLVALEGE